ADGQGHGLARLAAHLLDRVGDAHAEDVLAVDRQDVVAGLEAAVGGRRAVARRDHLPRAVFALDLQAEAAVFAAGLVLQVAVGFRRQIVGGRIARGGPA